MSALIPLAFLIGGLLGIRFKVLILVPAIGFVLAAVFCVGVARGDTPAAILVPAVLSSIFLQLGYFCGILTRDRLLPARLCARNRFKAQSAR